MGNLNESDKKSNALLFLQSLEQSYLTIGMVDELMKRWTDLGKPLFMLPKDFREKLLSGMESEVKFNYLVSYV